MSRHYVYVLLDPRRPGDYRYGKYRFKFEPFYVGKGSGGRCNAHWKRFLKNKENPDYVHNTDNPVKYARFLHMLADGVEPIAVIKHRYEDEDSAFDKEVELIQLIKRIRYGGPLLNLAIGGKRGVRTGAKLTDAQRKTMSDALSAFYETEEGKKAIQTMRSSVKKHHKARRELAKTDPKFAKKLREEKRKGSIAGWRARRDDPSKMKEYADTISSSMKAWYANATPRQRAMRIALCSLGLSLRKVPSKRREELREHIKAKLTRSRTADPERLKGIIKDEIERHV